MYLYTQSAAAAAAAALYRCSRCSSCCCSPSCAGWQKLLLIHWIWLHPKFSFFFLETRYILNIYIYIPLGSAVAFTASVCLYYVLGSYRHVRSQGGCEPHDTNQREKTWKKQGCCMITFARKGPLPAPHSFSCSFGRKAKSRVAPVGRWVLF